MSLLFRKRSIARAVAGELSHQSAESLRGHLRGCAPCRAHYDELMGTLVLLNPAGAADREKARLMRALDQVPVGGRQDDAATLGTSARPAVPPRRFWIPLVLVPTGAFAAWMFASLRAPAPTLPDDDIVWRGSTGDVQAQAQAPAETLLVYASRRASQGARDPVRLAGEIPASGECRVSVEDYVQFSAKGLRTPAHVTIAARDTSGRVQILIPRPGANAPLLQPAAVPKAIGPSLDLKPTGLVGVVRLYAVFSAKELDDVALQAAIAATTVVDAGARNSSVHMTTGTLLITP